MKSRCESPGGEVTYMAPETVPPLNAGTSESAACAAPAPTSAMHAAIAPTSPLSPRTPRINPLSHDVPAEEHGAGTEAYGACVAEHRPLHHRLAAVGACAEVVEPTEPPRAL